MKPKRTELFTGTSISNISLHSAYLGFAIRAAAVKTSQKRAQGIPVDRNIIEAIRYSYDFIDASAEYTYQLMKGGLSGDSRPQNWLTNYMDRRWNDLGLSDKLGLLSFIRCGEGFWRTDKQLGLFEDLRNIRNALTHPGMFGRKTEAGYEDFDSPLPVTSKTTFSGKMKRGKSSIAGFAEHPEELENQDARKAVEIALRHAERFEQLLGSKNAVLFGRINSRTGMATAADVTLSRMRRHFDGVW
jgi:hypothetical protein